MTEPEHGPEAFERVATPYLPLLWRCARRLVRTGHEAEDLVQETCLKAFRGYALKAGHPLEGSRQEAKPLPSTTFDIFPVVFRSVVPTPDLWPQTHPCLLTRGVGRVGAAPSTHQDQGL